MKNLLVLILTVMGCAASPMSDDVAAPASADSGGCAPGEQPVFGPEGCCVCEATPEWPPPRTGSREVTTACAVPDGTYHLTWSTDHETKVRPTFSTTKVLAISGDAMSLDQWTYALDWVDAGTANAWEPGDTDTVEFVVWGDCEAGVVRGTYTLYLPYYNPGHQVETWTFSARPT